MTGETLRRFLRKTVELLFNFKTGTGPPGAGGARRCRVQGRTVLLRGLPPLQPFGVERWWGRVSGTLHPVTGRATWARRGASRAGRLRREGRRRAGQDVKSASGLPPAVSAASGQGSDKLSPGRAGWISSLDNQMVQQCPSGTVHVLTSPLAHHCPLLSSHSLFLPPSSSPVCDLPASLLTV